MIIHPYNRFSQGARDLRKALREKGTPVTMSWKRPPKDGEWVINWGDSEGDFLNRYWNVLNKPKVVRLLTNKLRFFQHCVDGVPPWTTEKEKAKEWDHVFARGRLEGSGGEGITVWSREQGRELPDVRLYVRRVFSSAEYRIHVGRLRDEGRFMCLDTQRKVFQKSPDVPAPKDWAVRSHDNGFVFVRSDKPPEAVVNFVLSFVNTKFPDLDFCAFDVIVSRQGKPFILEGNTAPGLEGQTIETYCNYIRSVVR